MDSKEFTYQTQIIEHHLDTFGHVNNAKYLELFEEARWDFITKGGYGMKEIISFQKGPIVLEVKCRYKRELVNRETITIISTPTEHKQKIMRMHQVIKKEDGEIAAEAEFTFGFMDLKERKMIRPTPEWLKAIGMSN